MRSLRRLRAGFFISLTLLSLTAFQAEANTSLRLLRLTPTGEDVPASQQIVLQFDRPVVPLGRMERRADELPLTIEPAVSCAWRWLNPTTLACQLNDQTAMTPATRYTVTLRPGLQARDGATLDQTLTRTFITQRPTVSSVWFDTWTSPGTPEIHVLFDQPVQVDSVSRHLYMQLPDGKRVAVHTRPSRRNRPHLRVLTPVAALPLDTRVQLRVEPGVISINGPEPGVEQRIVVGFDTFPEFHFAGMRCTPNDNKSQVLAPGDPPSRQPKCNPLRPVSLLFSSPVLKEAVKDQLLITPSLSDSQTNTDPWDNVRTSSRLSSPHRRGQRYAVPLPGPLHAHTIYQLRADKFSIRDVFGRSLPNPIHMQFTMDHRPPQYHLNHPISVLEQNVNTDLPLVVTNLEQIHLDYETLTVQTQQANQTKTLAVDKVENIAHAIPLKIRDLIPADSGAVQGKLRTTPTANRTPQWFFSQVTPFHVHVKLGHYNTLVWVTRFDTGLPVPDATIQVIVNTFGQFDDKPAALSEATTTADGIALLAGSQTLDPALDLVGHWQRFKPHLMVRVQHQDQLALVPLIYDFQVRAYGPNKSYVPMASEQRYGHIHTWGTTAQGVYKAGDTVQYKFYVRDQDNDRFISATRLGYHLKIFDPTDKVVHEVSQLSLSEFGSYHGNVTIPAQGAVGWYRFVLSLTDTPHTWEPLRVLISDFTPAPFRVTTTLHGTTVAPNDTVTVTTQAKLHAGGPYADAPTRLTAQVRARPLQPNDARATGFWFDVRQHANLETIFQTESKVDATGTLETSFTLQAAQALYGQLVVESAVQDDRGKSIAHQATARYVGRDRYVGVRQEDWVLKTGESAGLSLVVVDDQGALAPGTPIQVKIEQEQVKAAQVKGAGNTYLTHYVREWVHLAACTLVSTAAPEVCHFTPDAPGTYKLTASITDTVGRSHSSSIQRWAVGPGAVVWETPPGHALQITPEKSTYSVGSTARYLVQNPYPGAQALITIERYGMQKSWRQTFANSLEMIDIPITADHLPGFYLSVVVMSPRVAAPLAPNQVDLGKPAFRLGYVRVAVQDRAKELDVTVTPHHPTYKPRQTATVDLHVKTHQGETPPVELAVAVLDEAVFDLIKGGRSYFDPYAGFYTLNALDVRNYNLLTRLIGRQKFEKKGANPGGGGGDLGLALRSMFKFVSYWNPSLRPNAAGKATISLSVPDNLTGWRVLAMAVTPEDRMGLGEGQFSVNQPTEIRPALPNQITAGDAFDARVTVMNRTEAARQLTVILGATGPIQSTAKRTVSLLAEPYQRYLVGLPVQALRAGLITLKAEAGDGQDHDAVQVTVPVHNRQTLGVTASYASTTADDITATIAFPLDIRTDTGYLSVAASPTVIGGLAGVFDYMRDYPYSCWEQVLTKGIMASQFRLLKRYLPDSVAWNGSAALPNQTLKRAVNYQAPNGGMTYYRPQDQYVSPYLSAYTGLAFNWLKSSGYQIPTQVEARLHTYLLQLLRRDVMPDFYSAGMSSTVRAVALAALAPHGKIDQSDIRRYRRHVPQMSLFGKAHYLLALNQVQMTAPLQRDIVQMIQAHADETSGKLRFSEAVDSTYQRILASPMRSNCAILSAFLIHAIQQPQVLGDTPFKLARSITQDRQNRGRWENTQENLFCMQALVEFSRVYERTTPRMTVQTYLDDALMGTAQLQSFQDKSVEMRRPIQDNDPGTTATVRVTRAGEGRLYTTTRLTYAPKAWPSTPINAGMTVHREYSVERDGQWQLLQPPMSMTQGELVRVDLFVSLPAARNFVVVSDPVPGGIEPVNRDLATASSVDADKAKMTYAAHSVWFQHDDWRDFGYSRWSFYHQELRHHAVRFYSEYLPAGQYHLSYVAQAIAPGTFTVLPTRAEEMYNPDTFGQGMPGELTVLAAKATKGTRAKEQKK